jgi:acyl-CoA dehydrogenase
MDTLLAHLVTAPLPEGSVDDVDAWWDLHRARAGAFDVPVDRAMAAALCMDRLGWAFASGYQEALRRLVPDLPPAAKTALCATEAGGNHPRAIQTSLVTQGDAYRLDGTKTFTTLGAAADVLLVVARDAGAVAEGGDAPRGRVPLLVVRIPSSREGVHVAPMPALPFVPEVQHAESRFQGVHVAADERLPGDGYAAYLKPFRTIEDIHVHAALLAWLLGTGRRLGWPPGLLERLLVGAITARSLALARPDAAAVHLAVAGLLAQTATVLEALEPCWDAAPAPLRERWRRDRRLLGVAQGARARRSEVAWGRLG